MSRFKPLSLGVWLILGVVFLAGIGGCAASPKMTYVQMSELPDDLKATFSAQNPDATRVHAARYDTQGNTTYEMIYVDIQGRRHKVRYSKPNSGETWKMTPME